MKTSELIRKLTELQTQHGDLDVRVNSRITSGKSERWDLIECQDAYVCGGKKAIILDALD